MEGRQRVKNPIPRTDAANHAPNQSALYLESASMERELRAIASELRRMRRLADKDSSNGHDVSRQRREISVVASFLARAKKSCNPRKHP